MQERRLLETVKQRATNVNKGQEHLFYEEKLQLFSLKKAWREFHQCGQVSDRKVQTRCSQVLSVVSSDKR